MDADKEIDLEPRDYRRVDARRPREPIINWGPAFAFVVFVAVTAAVSVFIVQPVQRFLFPLLSGLLHRLLLG